MQRNGNKISHEKCMTNAKMPQLPIAKQQDQLWPDLVYYGFANNFAVAMQDKVGMVDCTTDLWRNTRGAGGGSRSGPAAQEASVTRPEG